jgi:hypothetical protein
VYVQHVLMHRWDDAWPWVAVEEIVEATGAANRSVRDWKASLVAKGFLVTRPRGRAGGRGADEHDLSKLFAALEAIAVEDEVERATDQARRQLPAPTYYRGGLTGVPQLAGRERRKLETERVKPHASKAAENRRINAAENRRPMRPEPASIKRPEPASEKETVKKNLLAPRPPRGRRGQTNDRAPSRSSRTTASSPHCRKQQLSGCQHPAPTLARNCWPRSTAVSTATWPA